MTSIIDFMEKFFEGDSRIEFMIPVRVYNMYPLPLSSKCTIDDHIGQLTNYKVITTTRDNIQEIEEIKKYIVKNFSEIVLEFNIGKLQNILKSNALVLCLQMTFPYEFFETYRDDPIFNGAIIRRWHVDADFPIFLVDVTLVISSCASFEHLLTLIECYSRKNVKQKDTSYSCATSSKNLL